MKLPADVSVRTTVRDGFRDIEAHISADRLARVAAAGRIPSELHGALREHARFLVINLSTFMEDLSVQRTRSQLRHELIELLRALESGGGLPAIPTWLRSEIEGYFLRFRLDLPFGNVPTLTMQEAELQSRRAVEARAEVQAALSDSCKLVGVIEDVLRFLPRSPPYTRERFASRGSFRPELAILFGWIEDLWFEKLHRAPTMSTELQDFSIEVFKMCGVQIPGLSLQRRLQAMVRAAAKSKA
jgi:hypothetical protein